VKESRESEKHGSERDKSERKRYSVTLLRVVKRRRHGSILALVDAADLRPPRREQPDDERIYPARCPRGCGHFIEEFTELAGSVILRDGDRILGQRAEKGAPLSASLAERSQAGTDVRGICPEALP